MAKKNKALDDWYKEAGIKQTPKTKSEQRQETASKLSGAAKKYNIPQSEPARIEASRSPMFEKAVDFLSNPVYYAEKAFIDPLDDASRHVFSAKATTAAERERQRRNENAPAQSLNTGRMIAGWGIKAADDIVSGVAGLGDMTLGTAARAFGWKDNPFSNFAEATKATQAANRAYYDKNVEKAGKVVQTVDTLGTALVEALPQLALAYMTGGSNIASGTLAKGGTMLAGTEAAQAASKLPGAIKTAQSVASGLKSNPQFWASFVDTTGRAYNTAKEDGADDWKATMYATTTGLINAAIEVGGGIQTLPTELQKGGKALMQWLDSAVDEGKEEVVQGIVERGMQALVYGKDNPLFSISDENAVFNPVTSAKEFGSGFAIGGLLSAGPVAINSRSNVTPDMIAEVVKASPNVKAEDVVNLANNAAVTQSADQGNNTPVEVENAAEAIAESNAATQTETPVKAGRATVIKNPYNGEKPQQSEKPTAAVEMPEDSVRAAQEEISEAQELSERTGRGFKTVLTRFYQKLFQRAENVPVNGLSFAGEQYLVQIGSGVPGKVISDKNLSAEKLAVLDVLPDVVKNAEYIGSGEYSQRAGKNKPGVRYDYFETSLNIGNEPYIVKFDVEVLPDVNNYRTHQIVNVDLIQEGRLEGTLPPPSSDGSNPQEYSLTDTGENVKNQISPEDSTGAAPLGYDPYSNWQNRADKYHPEGENPARPVDLPVTNPQGKQTMRGGRTVMEAEATPDQRVREIEQAFVNGKFAYTPQSNDSRVKSATETIERVGWQKAKDDWTAAVRAGKSDADLVAMGAVLFNNAANSGMTAEQFLDLAKDYIQLSHNAGQALQAQRILKTLTPESRLFMMQRSVQDLNEEYKKKLGDKAPDIQIDQQLLQNYLDAKTDAERNTAEEAIQQNIAAQLPSTWMDKWTALRYVNMLGNFKTQARNLLGNTTMGLTAKAKREVLAAMEHVAHIVTGGKYERMTSFVVSPKLYAAARADFENVQKAALGEAKFGDISAANNSQFMREVNDKKRVFKFGVLEAYRKATNWAMEQGDVIFSRANYANALAGYLKAHGVTAEMMENGTVDQDVLDRGRLYAIKEAQESTFRDTNAFSGWVSQIARKQTTPKAVRAVSEGVLPFRKTPANVLVRGEEYSPLGVVNALVKTFQAKNVNSDVTANDALNQWAKTLTGSAVCAAGFLLAQAGNLIGAKDKNEKQASFDSLTGQQEYSIIINGKSYTIDTFSPTVMPLLVGGTLYDLMEEGGLNPKDIESAITSLADPMINMSMLSGVNDALSNVQFSDNNLIQMALTSAAGYLSQGLTNTLVGQFERTFEGENRMSTYTDEESMLPSWLQKSIGKASAKTPLLEYNQTEYINNWGETESNGNLAERAINNFLNPAYVSEISTDPVDQELARLHEVLGVTDIYPKSLYDVPDMKLHGKEVNLNQAQKENYQKTYGQTANRQIASLMNTKEYRNMTDAEKAAAVKSILEYATNEGRKKIKADSDDLTWTDKSDGSVAQNAAYRAMYQTAAAMLKNRTGEDSVKDAALVQEVARQNKDFNTTIQIMAQFLSEGMQDRYENAYENGYDFTTAAKLVEAYNEKSYDFGTTDSGNPAGRGKDGTIKWAQENLGLTYAQAVTLWTYMCKK